MEILHWGWTRPCNRHPYHWIATAPGELLETTTAEMLSESFPTTAFVRVQAGPDSAKDYRNYSRPLTTPDGRLACMEGLSPSWRLLTEELCSLHYRRAVAEILGQASIAKHVELRLVQHGVSDFLGPHTDRSDKLFSHIVYFNPGWNAQWGGDFEVLDAQFRVLARIQPECGASVLLGRSSSSWHRVVPVREAAARERRSLVVHGLRS